MWCMVTILTVVLGIGEAVNNPVDKFRFTMTFSINSIFSVVLILLYNIATGKYGKDRAEFEKKWGALNYGGKFVHPKSISDVAEAMVRNNGGAGNCLRYLDKRTRCNWNHYFYLEGMGKRQRVSPMLQKLVNTLCCCACVGDTLDKHYMNRYDGVDTHYPYHMSTKRMLYPGINMESIPPPVPDDEKGEAAGVITSQPSADVRVDDKAVTKESMIEEKEKETELSPDQVNSNATAARLDRLLRSPSILSPVQNTPSEFGEL